MRDDTSFNPNRIVMTRSYSRWSDSSIFDTRSQLFTVFYTLFSLNANDKNIKFMTKVGENGDRVIMLVIDLYLLRKGMTGLNYESCLSNCTIYIVKLLISKFITCCFYMWTVVHRRENFKSPSQYKFITAIQF